MFKRKIYDALLQWKIESDGKTALLIEGARRIGKTTIVEEFAKHECQTSTTSSSNSSCSSRSTCMRGTR